MAKINEDGQPDFKKKFKGFFFIFQELAVLYIYIESPVY